MTGGLADTRAGIRDTLAESMPGVLVIGDPRQVVPPCVFVDLITITGNLTGCTYQGQILVWALGTPDPDAVGAAQIDRLADLILAAPLAGPPTTAGRLLQLPGGLQLPGYAITLPVTVDIVEVDP